MTPPYSRQQKDQGLEITAETGNEDEAISLNSVTLLEDFLDDSESDKGSVEGDFGGNKALASMTVTKEGSDEPTDSTKADCQLWTRGLEQSFKVCEINVSYFFS